MHKAINIFLLRRKAMIQLHPMTDIEFSEYKPFLIESYAQDIARNNQSPLEEARASSTSQINELLKDGIATPNQRLYEIWLVEGSSENRMGYLWLDVDEIKHRCFIYDIYLHEAFRGRGMGRKTLELIEAQMIERNIQRISLHVFGDNTVARELYEKLGYEVTGLNMQKWLSAKNPG
jgi:ribosomal protein S18 acetylase RimI-like enzyme